MQRLNTQELIENINGGTQFIDIRRPENFTSGFLSGSIFLSADHDFRRYFDAFVNPSKPFLLIVDAEPDKEFASAFKAAENFKGYHLFEIDELRQAGISLDLVVDVLPDEFALDIRFDDKVVAVDLRDTGNFIEEHIEDSVSLPLIELVDIAQIASFDEDAYLYFYSDTIHDALTACSIFKRHGLHDLRVVSEGWDEIKKEESIRIERPKQSGNKDS